MHFSKITFDSHGLTRLLQYRGADEYFFHQLLWELFSDQPSSRRDFIYHQALSASQACFYIVSKRPPTVPPNRAEVMFAQSKPYHPTLRNAQSLNFLVRVNPAVRKTSLDGRTARHDVVMEAKRIASSADNSPTARMLTSDLVTQRCQAWLSKRCELHGFTFKSEEVMVNAYRQHSFPRRGSRVSFSSVELSGILTVCDPDSFRRALYSGIGPAKGFGNGLILIRPRT